MWAVDPSDVVQSFVVENGLEVIRLYESMCSGEDRGGGQRGGSVKVKVGGMGTGNDVALEVEASK